VDNETIGRAEANGQREEVLLAALLNLTKVLKDQGVSWDPCDPDPPVAPLPWLLGYVDIMAAGLETNIQIRKRAKAVIA
jgi:hypothetical protein